MQKLADVAYKATGVWHRNISYKLICEQIILFEYEQNTTEH